ncbi:hypothetical protein [Streptomyces sp. NRRL S-495]|nr:hypothetical protein [Streptomyces sp. NRRL S-495]
MSPPLKLCPVLATPGGPGRPTVMAERSTRMAAPAGERADGGP